MINTARSRLAACVVLAAIGLSIQGTGFASEQPDWLASPVKKPLKEIRLGITVLNPSSNAYQAQYTESAREYAQELGIQATIVDPAGDPTKQFSQIQNLAAQRVDAIIVWPTSEVAVVPAIRQAQKAGIPVVISNAEIVKEGRAYTAAWTGPDDCEQARSAAKLMVDALGGKGNVVMILGTPGFSPAMLRERCFVEYLKDYPEVRVLDKQPADWSRAKAQSIMESFLIKYGRRIDGVYAHDDGMGLGALSAIKSAGYKPGEIKLVTTNLFGEGYDAMQAGWHQGSIYQSPIEYAKLAIQTAIKVIEGQPVEREQSIDAPIINASTLDQFSRPSW